MEAFTLATCGAICRATLITNVHNVSKNVSKNVPVTVLSGTVHTQTHVNAQCDVSARTKYRRRRGHANFVGAHGVRVLSH